MTGHWCGECTHQCSKCSASNVASSQLLRSDIRPGNSLPDSVWVFDRQRKREREREREAEDE